MIKINALGNTCPIPVIKAKRALNEMGPDGTLVISVDNDIARQNLEKMARELGYSFGYEKISDDRFDISITKGGGALQEAAARSSGDGVMEKTVAVFSSDKMGDGDPELGKALLKAFVYSLTELPQAPEAVLLYNAGVFLTTGQSPLIEDFKKLEEKGASVLSCGACLNYYGLSDKLGVGSVTNMYDILQRQAGSARIIKP